MGIINKIKVGLASARARSKKLGISQLTIEHLYTKSNSYSVKHKAAEESVRKALLRDVSKAKNTKDLAKRITSNYPKYAKRDRIDLNILTYPLLKRMDISVLGSLNTQLAGRLLENNYSFEEMQEFTNRYAPSITQYILSDNNLKNKLLPSKDGVIDFTKKFTEEDFNALVNSLKTKENHDRMEITNSSCFLLQRVLVPLMCMYSKQDLNNHEFIDFEIKNGYFKKYFDNLMAGKPIPTVEERKSLFEKERAYTPEQISLFKQSEDLYKKISTLSNEDQRGKLLVALKSAIKDGDYIKLEKVNSFFQRAYKEEILSALHSPKSSETVFSDFDDLDVIMVHSFIRSPESIIEKYRDKAIEEIISRRKDDNKDPNLTELEEKILDGLMEKAREKLNNQAAVEETVDINVLYSDASNIQHYISNTSNQISASIFSPENILKLGPSVGIGFDQNSVPSENIVISSRSYLTTNKGLQNIEILGGFIDKCSSTLQEMLQESANEVLMLRKGPNASTKSAYVYVALCEETDEKAIQKNKTNMEKARQLAKKNNLPLIVFDIPKLKQSYQNKQKQTIKR